MHVQVVKPTKLFVYGTLKRGFGNNKPRLEKALYVKDSCITGLMFHLGGFPGVVLKNCGAPVWGEVFDMSPDLETIMADCDQLEGHPHHYRRTLVEIDHEWVWTYEWQGLEAAVKRGGARVIPYGRWYNTNTHALPFRGEVTSMPHKTLSAEMVYMSGVGLINTYTGEIQKQGGPKQHFRHDSVSKLWVPVTAGPQQQQIAPQQSRLPVTLNASLLPASTSLYIPPTKAPKYVDDMDPGEETITADRKTA